MTTEEKAGEIEQNQSIEVDTAGDVAIVSSVEDADTDAVGQGDLEAQPDDPEKEDLEDIPVTFDWSVYVDATLAGLAVLVPLPFVDNLLECFFARRMIRAIAARRKIDLPPDRVTMVNNRWTCCGILGACLYFPIFIVMELLLSFFKLLVFCCTVKRATDALNYYWQRAFLMDYILQRGYLTSDDAEQAELAIRNMDDLLDTVAVSPFNQLARKIIYGPCRIFCSLMRYVCRGGRKADSSIDQTQATMSESWTGFSSYLASLAKRYEAEFEKSQRPRRGWGCCCFRPYRTFARMPTKATTEEVE